MRADVGLLSVSVTCKKILKRVKNNSRALGYFFVGCLVGWISHFVPRPGPQPSVRGNQERVGKNLKNSVSGHREAEMA